MYERNYLCILFMFLLYTDRDKGSRKFKFKWDEQWFFCEPHSFVFTHFPFENRMPAPTKQNITEPMTIQNWLESAIFEPVIFDYGLQPISHFNLWINTDKKNCVDIKFSSTYDMNFSSELSKNGVPYNDACCISVSKNIVNVRIVLPEVGKFKFELYASLAFVEEASRSNELFLVCVYGINNTVKAGNNKSFPKVHPYWGPTYLLDHYGLLPISHLKPSVNLKAGKAVLKFKIKNTSLPAPELMFRLRKGTDIIKQQFYGWINNNGVVHLEVYIIKTGLYRLTVYGKSKEQEGYWDEMANYLIEANESENKNVETGRCFPEWPYLLGPTNDCKSFGITTKQFKGYIKVENGQFIMQFQLEKFVNINHDFYLLVNNVNDTDLIKQDISESCVYAYFDESQRSITYIIRMRNKGFYFFRLHHKVYLANYFFKNSQAYTGELFPSRQGLLWGLTSEGVEFGLKRVVYPAETSTAVRMVGSVAILELKIEKSDGVTTKSDNRISANLFNREGVELSKECFELEQTNDMVKITVGRLKLGHYKVNLWLSSSIKLGTFLIVAE